MQQPDSKSMEKTCHLDKVPNGLGTLWKVPRITIFLIKQNIILPVSGIQIKLVLSLWKKKDHKKQLKRRVSHYTGFPQFTVSDAGLESLCMPVFRSFTSACLKTA